MSIVVLLRKITARLDAKSARELHVDHKVRCKLACPSHVQ